MIYVSEENPASGFSWAFYCRSLGPLRKVAGWDLDWGWVEDFGRSEAGEAVKERMLCWSSQLKVGTVEGERGTPNLPLILAPFFTSCHGND